MSNVAIATLKFFDELKDVLDAQVGRLLAASRYCYGSCYNLQGPANAGHPAHAAWLRQYAHLICFPPKSRSMCWPLRPESTLKARSSLIDIHAVCSVPAGSF